MLDFVRTKQKSILIKIAFGLIILSFVIGYTMLTAPKDRSGQRPNDVAATVNGTEISYASFQTAYSNLYNLYQSIYQGNFNSALEKQLNLPKQALQQLVEEELLVKQADAMDLKVSDKELVDSIAKYEAFQVNGQFNRDRYLQVLNYQRMTPEQFEAAQRRQLLTQKVREQLQQGAVITEDELEQAFHNENDKVNLTLAWLTPTLVETKVKVDDQGLQDFFDKNREQFRIPEKVAIRYLQFDPARYQDQLPPFTDEELQRYYQRNIDKFEIKEEVRAAHILLSLPKDADQETIDKRKALAGKLLQQLRDGADFAALAKANSDDKSNADKGGDLGTFGRGVMVPEFEKAAFALQPGQLSEVVRTAFGFHIIKVSEHTEAGFKPLVAVIDQVKQGLTKEKAAQLAFEKAMDAYNINRKTGDLETAASANNLGIKETGYFALEDPIDGIGKILEVSQAAFALKPGELAKPIQTADGVFLFTLKDRRDSYLPELAEVKNRVEQAYRAEQAQTLAKELADQLLADAKASKDLTAAAKNLKVPTEATGEFSRGYGSFVPRVGPSPELADTAFKLTKEAPVGDKVFEIGNRFLVAGLKDSKVADFTKADQTALDQLKDRLLTEKKNQLVNKKLNDLLQQADIIIMVPDLINAFKNGSAKS